MRKELMRYSLQPMIGDEEKKKIDEEHWRNNEYEFVQQDRELNPRAGMIVSALGNYRRTHPIVNFYHLFKEIIGVIKQEIFK